MKILGVSGSNRPASKSGTYKLVEHVLKATGCEYDLISLYGKTIKGCTGCLGCTGDNICVVDDDMANLRKLIVEADGLVIGSPNYYSGLNAATHAFLERFFQFRHQKCEDLWGKLAVSIGIGGISGAVAADDIEKFLLFNFIETVAKVSGRGVASCFTCGYGETCEVGIPRMVYGDGVKITDDMLIDVMDQPELLEEAEAAGKLLAKRLSTHNPANVAAEMQLVLGKKFVETA